MVPDTHTHTFTTTTHRNTMMGAHTGVSATTLISHLADGFGNGRAYRDAAAFAQRATEDIRRGWRCWPPV